MKFKIPGQPMSIRLFESVETVDDQYHIVDVGVEFAEGGIDSIAIGAATHSAAKWVNRANRKQEEKAAKKAAKKAKKEAAQRAVDDAFTPESVTAE